MDEIEFAQSMKNLRALIEYTTEPDNVFAHVNIKNALLTIMHMLSALNERILELQVDEDE